jgi:hypothetical protein
LSQLTDPPDISVLDIDPAYVDVAIERWSARTGLEPRLEVPTS